MKNNFIFFLLVLLSACASKNQKEISVANPLKEKAISTWEGVIPCADCPGIVYTLTLKKDSNYIGKMVYEEKSVEPIIDSGNWIINDTGKIILSSAEKGSSPQYLLFKEKFVEMLDGDGNKIETNLNYRLHRK